MTDKNEVLELAKQIAMWKRAAEALRAAYTPDATHDCFATGPSSGDVINDLIACPGCAAEGAYQEALSATQQSSEALLAEVRAKALEDYLARVNNTTLLPGIDFLQAMSIANAMIAELRSSAAQPEGGTK